MYYTLLLQPYFRAAVGYHFVSEDGELRKIDVEQGLYVNLKEIIWYKLHFEGCLWVAFAE